MHVVGARLGNRVVDHARGLSELARKAAGHQLHFPHQHFRDWQHPQPGASFFGVRLALMLAGSNFLNPCGSATTRWRLSGNNSARSYPPSLVVTDRALPVSVLVIVTVTPGSTPDDTSDTVPSIAPLAACDCASAGVASR